MKLDMEKKAKMSRHYEKCADKPMVYRTMDLVWSSLPNIGGSMLVTILVFFLGSAMRGDWLLIFVHFMKMWHKNSEDAEFVAEKSHISVLQSLRLQGVHTFILVDSLCSYAVYFGVGGFLHWWWYVRQRDNPETWKCQPKQWLSQELQKHAIKAGSKNIGIGSMIFGSVACYISNGGYTTLYTEWDEYGWPYLIISVPLIFLYQDLAVYYCHRAMHIPFLYKRYHKQHHYYKQPTPFTASALHPTEFLIMQSLMMIPMFTLPIHTVVYFGNLMYVYYYGIITHSGINLKPIWPWQADVIFHDNHHQFFHVNFGFNFTIWDKLHGTYRRKDRIYGEEIFGGEGKTLTNATTEEIKINEEELQNEITAT